MVLCHQVRWMAARAVNEDFFPNTNSIVFTVRPNGIGMSSRHRPEFQMTRNMIVLTGRKEQLSLRRHGLQRVDRELSRGNFKTALSIVKQLQEKPGGLYGFGAAKLQVPRSVNTLDELKLIRPDILPLLPLVDPLLELVDRSLKIATLESISFNELESSILDTDSLCEEKHLMCMQHEAGHFLIAYLLGILPRGYAVPSIEAFWKDKFIVGKVEFVGFEFLKEVNRGNFSSKNLNRFSCITLAGLVSEYLVFGFSEGSYSDIEKLNRIFKCLGFTESEADSQVKWALLNTVILLLRHREARSKLAEAMGLGKSVGFCINTIENSINGGCI